MRFILLALMVVACTVPKDQSTTVFRIVPSSESGITFANTLKEDVSTLSNLFDFDYFYNGAGVAIGDINNDGLQDIFFTANQVPNRLYLNKGGLKFEDISAKAGINDGKKWSNGAAMADVNADGFLDIYISQGGPNLAEDRKNLLFINNGDLSFTESAETYGLADEAISTQSAFFDYDKDGDLDCVVMNETPLYGYGPVQFHQLLLQNKDAIYESSSHLYENVDGKFKDVTISSGIYKPSFGLGLVVSDINDDGWLDIYMANDYYLPDNLYINNGKGYFIDQIGELTNQVSFYGMGADIADINNDLSQDIFVLDMASSDHKRSKTLMASMDPEAFDLLTNKLGFHTQYMFNSLQLNDGSSHFNNVSHMGDMAKTDWSWTILMTDFNNDGFKEAYVTNGYRKYALDNDFKNEVNKARVSYQGRIPLEVKADLYQKMPSEKLPNLMYTSNGNMDFYEVAADWGLGQPSYSNGAATADLDNDGDLDLVVNNIDETAFLYENQSNLDANYLRVKVSASTSEAFAKVTIYYGSESQMNEIKRVRGYRSSVDPVAHFGLGDAKKVDSIRVNWLEGGITTLYDVQANQEILVDIADAQNNGSGSEQQMTFPIVEIPFEHKENDFNDFAKEVLLPYKQSTLGPKAAFHEEGKLLFLGGPFGQKGAVYRYTEEGTMEMVSQIDSEDFEDLDGVFLDVENDGDLDLFVISGGNSLPEGDPRYQDRLYLNNGDGQFASVVVPGLQDLRSSGGCVEVLDLDGDGYQDIVVGSRIRPQGYPLPGTSYVLSNNKGELRVASDEIIEGFSEFGIVNDITSADIDNDGLLDLIVVGEWTKIGVFRNMNGYFQDVTENAGIGEFRGWWYSVTPTDVNGDGLMDFVVGNIGWNSKFKASLSKPFKVFADDFDSTGTLDIVLSKKYKEQYVPVRGRECSSEQMPFIKDKYATYNDFADATIDDIFGPSIEEAYKAEATEFSSALILNEGEGKFSFVSLPWQAQMFPLLDAVTHDFDGDGQEDLIIGGNIYNTEVETPRLDAQSGLVLYARGDTYLAGPSLKIPGNVKSLELLNNGGQALLLVTRNNDTSLGYQLESAQRSL